MFALLAVLVNLAATAVVADCLISNPLSSSCDASGPVSCSAHPPPQNTCCYEDPGVGLITQIGSQVKLTHLSGTATPDTGMSWVRYRRPDSELRAKNMLSSGRRTHPQAPVIAGRFMVRTLSCYTRSGPLTDMSRSLG
jgi:hypothetical protein